MRNLIALGGLAVEELPLDQAPSQKCKHRIIDLTIQQANLLSIRRSCKTAE
jgi:hypothetical protein